MTNLRTEDELRQWDISMMSKDVDSLKVAGTVFEVEA
jgi:hypothetical protein